MCGSANEKHRAQRRLKMFTQHCMQNIVFCYPLVLSLLLICTCFIMISLLHWHLSCFIVSGESSGDSDRWSLTSSAYSSFRSQTGYDISSLRGSVRSTASSQSSGIGSLSSRAGSVRSSDSRRFKFPNLFKKKKAHGDLLEAQEESDKDNKS